MHKHGGTNEMKQKKASRFWIQLLCWVLIAMMVIGAITYSIYALLAIL